MELRYCEICGVAIAPRDEATGSGDRAICDRCFQSRRVLIPPSVGDVNDSDSEPSTATGNSDGVFRFGCCYCEIELQLRPVETRTPVKCPRCGELFVLTPDGRAEPSSGRNAVGWLVGGAAEQDSSDGQDSGDEQDSGDDQVPVLGDFGVDSASPVSSSDTTVVHRSRAEHDLDELTPRGYEFLADVPERSTGSPDILIDDSESDEVGLGVDSDDLPSALSGLTQDVDRSSGPASEETEDQGADSSSGAAAAIPGLANEPVPRGRGGNVSADARPASSRRGQKQASGRAPKRDSSQRRPGSQRAMPGNSASGRLAAETASALGKSRLQATQRRAMCLGLAMVAVPVLVVLPFLVTTLRGRGFAVRGQMAEALAAMGQALARGAHRLDARLLDGQVFPDEPLPRAAPEPDPPSEASPKKAE